MSPFARLRASWRNACAANADPDDCQPLWPWAVCGCLCLVIIGLLFAGALYLSRVALTAPTHPPPTKV